MRQAEETYMQAVNRLARKAVNVRSEARDAYRVYRSTYDIARHYQREVLPLRKIISDEMHAALQRHADRRVRAADRSAPAHRLATRRRSKPQRDFWLAATDLQTADHRRRLTRRRATRILDQPRPAAAAGH